MTQNNAACTACTDAKRDRCICGGLPALMLSDLTNPNLPIYPLYEGAALPKSADHVDFSSGASVENEFAPSPLTLEAGHVVQELKRVAGSISTEQWNEIGILARTFLGDTISSIKVVNEATYEPEPASVVTGYDRLIEALNADLDTLNEALPHLSGPSDAELDALEDKAYGEPVKSGLTLRFESIENRLTALEPVPAPGEEDRGYGTSEREVVEALFAERGVILHESVHVQLAWDEMGNVSYFVFA